MVTLTFKSNPFFFEKEKSGIKPNTVRQVGVEDSRFDDILEMMQTKDYGKIRILKTLALEEFFERQITDISYYNEMFIISWKEESGK